MVKSPVSFRLSEQGLFVIDSHKNLKQLVDRTEALEDILRIFGQWQRAPIERIKRFLNPSAPSVKPLEAFISG